MPETPNAATQLETKNEANEKKQTQEYQASQTPVSAQKETKANRPFDENRPSYNPLLGDTPAKYAAILSGSDQEHPLFEVGEFGFTKFHPENLRYQKGPASVQFDTSTGAWDVEGRRKALNDHIDQVAREISSYAEVMAPEYARSQDRNNAVKRTIAGGGEFVGHTASSFWSMFLNAGIGTLAQERNIAEGEWSIYKSKIKDTPAYAETVEFLRQLEQDSRYSKVMYDENGQFLPDAFEFQKSLAFSKKVQDEFGLSSEAREILSHYQELVEKREEDERRMMIGVVFDDSESALSGWVNSKMDITEADEQESVAMMLGKLGGDVTGSLAAAWLTARAGAGAIGAIGGAFTKTQQTLKAANAIKNAAVVANGGATAALAAGASISEGLITVPVFLNQYNQIRTEALLSGKGIDEANGIGFMAGAVEAGLEFAGFKFFKRFYRADGIFTNYILRNIVPEALQEGSQTFAENVITQTFGVTQKQWSDIMYEIGMSMVAGAIGGGVFTFGRFRQEGATAWLENISNNFKENLTNILFEDIDVGVETALETATLEENAQGELTTSQAAIINRERAAAKERYDKLTADQKKAHDEFLKAYKDLRKYYETRAKEVNPDITKKELNMGFNAIKVMTKLQKDGNILTNHYYAAVNTMVSYLNKAGKLEQYNIKEIKKKLFNSGLTRKQVEALTSKDAIERNNAQWEVAENHIAKDLMSQGVSEAEAKLSARFTRALASESTLLNPSVTPLQMVKKMHAHVVNIQNAVFFKMDLKGRFAPITDKFVKYGYVQQVSTERAFRFLNKVADMLLNNNPSAKETRDANLKLFGDANVDPNLNSLRALAKTQAGMIEETLKHMPVDANPSQKDCITMFLLNRFGMGWTEIFDLYGYKMKGNRKDADKFFNQAAAKYFRKPSNENVASLNRIDATMSEDTMNEYSLEEKDLVSKATGFYSKDKNLLVLNNPTPGTAFHEYGHFALTTLVTNQLELARMGLLPDTSPLYGIYNRLHKKLSQEGKVLTEREFQETVLDATMNVIERGQTTDPTLTALITMMKSEGYMAKKRLVGSLLNSSTKNQLSLEGKKALKKEVADILNGLNPTNILQRAYALRDMSLFRSGIDPTISNAANNKKMTDMMAEQVLDFLRTIPVKDTDLFTNAVKKAQKTGNIMGVAAVAERVSAQAIDLATDVICENEQTTDVMRETDMQAAPHLWRNGAIFFEADAAALPADMAPGFRDVTPLWEDIKKKWPGISEVINNIVNSLKRYLQSLEGSSGEVSNRLRDIIMREVWTHSMSIENFRETIAPCVQAYDEYYNKLNKTEKSAAGIEWRRNFHAVLGSSKPDSRKKAREFLKSKLGEKAAESWDNAIDLLDGNQEKYNALPASDPNKILYKGIKNLMLEAGIDVSIFNGMEFFFPMAVDDYNGLTQEYFGHSYTYNEIDKARERVTKEYLQKHGTKNEKGEITLTKEQEAELQTVVSDAINSQFQRNISDENKVTAFFKRTIFDYEKNPEMLRYYKDPFTTLEHYMDAAYRTIMMRNLIGKVQYDENGKPMLDDFLTNSGQMASMGKVGQYLAMNSASLSGESVERFRRAMHDFVSRDSGDKSNLFNVIRDMNSFTTLGSIFSTLNQLQDLEFCFAMYGIKPTLKAINDVLTDYDSDAVVKLHEVGGETSNEAFRPGDQTITQRITKKVYSKTGFEWADRKVKEVALNAFNNWAQDVLRKNIRNIQAVMKENETGEPVELDIKNNAQVAQFKYILDEIYPEPDDLVFANNMTESQLQQERMANEEQRSRIIKSFIKGESTPETKYVQWYMLTKMQPMNAAAVPGGFNSAGPFGKLLYQFNTVAIRQIGFLTDYWKLQEKIGGKYHAAVQMAKFYAFALSVGIPKETLEALLKGQTPQVSNMILSPLHVFMINSYVLSVLKRDGGFKAATSAFSPKWGSFDNITKDAYGIVTGSSYKGFTFKSVPVIGMPMWYWFFGGREAAKKQDIALFHRKYVRKDSSDRKSRAEASLRFLEGKDED